MWFSLKRRCQNKLSFEIYEPWSTRSHLSRCPRNSVDQRIKVWGIMHFTRGIQVVNDILKSFHIFCILFNDSSWILIRQCSVNLITALFTHPLKIFYGTIAMWSSWVQVLKKQTKCLWNRNPWTEQKSTTRT